MSRNIQEIVEQQLIRWREEQGGAAPWGKNQQERPPVIVISHAFRSNGEAIADQIADELQLPHHDHAIVEHIASSAQVHLETVESLDRHVQGRIDEYIAALFHERNFDRGDYLRLLGRTVVALWEHGPCVLSGHGAVHFVPPEHALAVRLTASVEVRAQRLAREQGIDLHRARGEVRRADAEQQAFHRRFFGVDVDDPAHYDLVIDTARLGAAVVPLVEQAFQLHFGPLSGNRPALQRLASATR